jgi:hypothetical protein
LVKYVCLATLRPTSTIEVIAVLVQLSPQLTFADALVSAIEPSAGVEALSTAMAERCTITIIYEHGWQRPTPRMITPRLVLEVL